MLKRFHTRALLVPILLLLLLFSSLSRIWAHHCHYATLLASRCANNLRYYIIFPMGPSFLSMLVFALSFPLSRCGCLYWVEIFQNGVTLCLLLTSSCFTSVSLWVVYCFEYSSAAPYVYSTACPSYANALILKRRLNRRWISSVYYSYWMCLYPLVSCARVRVFDMIGQLVPVCTWQCINDLIWPIQSSCHHDTTLDRPMWCVELPCIRPSTMEQCFPRFLMRNRSEHTQMLISQQWPPIQQFKRLCEYEG